MKQTQKQLCIDPKKTITGFNYNFTEALLKKLKQLKDEDGIFIETISDRVDATAATVISYLSQQTKFNPEELDGISGGHQVPSHEIDNLIRHIEEFLAIFEEKK